MVAAVDGVSDTSLDTGIEEVVLAGIAIGVVREGTALEQARAPDLRVGSLGAQIEVEVARQVVHLAPQVDMVAMCVVVVIDDIAHVGYVVRVVEVHLALVGLQVLRIFVDVVVEITAQQVVDHLIVVRSGKPEVEAARQMQVGIELMGEEGGGAGLQLVVVTLSQDVFGRPSGDGVVLQAVGVEHRAEMAHVGGIERIPVNLGHRGIAVDPSLFQRFDLGGAVAVLAQVARQVTVVVGTRVLGIAPFKGGLSCLAGKEIGRRGERGLLRRGPVPGQLGHRLVVVAHP